MKHVLFSMLMFLLSSQLVAQKVIDYRKEMIESGEGHETPFKNNTTQNDYSSFLKAKLSSSQNQASSIFSKPVELDMAIIGGRVRASLADKTSNIFLVAPSGGGLWNFTPATGKPFTPINDFGSFMPVTDIAQNPNNKQNIIIGTGDNNHGVTGNGLFESKDGGKTFKQIVSTDPKNNTLFKYITFVKFSPEIANTIYLAASNKLFKSTDAGVTWIEVFSGLTFSDIKSVDFLGGQGVIIGTNYVGLFISPNGNKDSFILQKNGVPNDPSGGTRLLDGVVAATYAANRNTAYAIFTGMSANNVYKTSDAGTTWVKLATPSSIYMDQTTFCLTMGVHPTNPNIVVVGSVGWGYTLDGGNTWHSGIGLEVDFHSVHFHPSDPNIAYLGYDQGLGSVNFGKYVDYQEWNGMYNVTVSQPEQIELGKQGGFNTSQIYYGDYYPEAYGDAYIQEQQDGGCFAKVGNIETRVLVGDGGSVFINKQDPAKAFASVQNGYLSNTTSAIPPEYNYNQIKSFPFYNNHPNFITQFAGNNSDGAQMYIADKVSIKRTLNSGASFISIVGHSLDAVQVAVQDFTDPVVYAIGNNKITYNTDVLRIDNAATNPIANKKSNILTYLSNNELPNHITIDPNNVNSVYLTSQNGKAYLLSNMNTDTPIKKTINGNIPDVFFNIVIGVKNKPDLLIAGTNIGLFYSIDSGTTWVLNNDLPYTKITDLKLRNSDNRLFVFTFGRGAWATTVNNTPVYKLSTTVFLEGAYNSGTGLMNTSLNSSSLIPLSQPYNTAPWNYAGTEHIAAIPTDIVDWVLVELRQAVVPANALSGTIMSGWPKACFLKSNGSIVDLDGISPLTIGNPLITGNLYVVIRHRTHLAIMSASGTILNGETYNFDFSTGVSQAFGGSSGYKMVGSGVNAKAVMITGDMDRDGNILVSDYNVWAVGFGGNRRYVNSDIDLDGNAMVSDYNKWSANFGSTTGNTLKSSLQKIKYKSSVPQ